MRVGLGVAFSCGWEVEREDARLHVRAGGRAGGVGAGGHGVSVVGGEERVLGLGGRAGRRSDVSLLVRVVGGDGRGPVTPFLDLLARSRQQNSCIRRVVRCE